MARPEVLVERSSVLGPEIDDKDLLDSQWRFWTL
jgi:hypothetical protein